MLHLNLQITKQGRLNILCLGAHSDDIEIGCGGTILRMLQEYPKMDFFWVVFSANPQRAEEARRSAARFLERSQTSTAPAASPAKYPSTTRKMRLAIWAIIKRGSSS